jgi:hypothetical protein
MEKNRRETTCGGILFLNSTLQYFPQGFGLEKSKTLDLESKSHQSVSASVPYAEVFVR